MVDKNDGLLEQFKFGCKHQGSVAQWIRLINVNIDIPQVLPSTKLSYKQKVSFEDSLVEAVVFAG